MKTPLSIAKRIKSMKSGQSFTVTTEKERQEACKVGKVLRDSGSINFQVVTKSIEGKDGYTVAAI